ncbi:hypothetical protein RRG08_062851 [Elysia crispata]|uniref:Uncharacterized protein n=1 Tax=Elysia crispata TaxID=231223 RepID=A0AAE0ZAD6_9GAST|nr:hypothetical protein RRG08_062851 [Elysia crispata]
MENESLDFDMNDSTNASSNNWVMEDESTSSEDGVSPLRPSVSHNTKIPEQRQDLTYGCIDPGPKSPIPSFKPARTPGLYLSDEPMTRQDKRKFLTADVLVVPQSYYIYQVKMLSYLQRANRSVHHVVLTPGETHPVADRALLRAMKQVYDQNVVSIDLT